MSKRVVRTIIARDTWTYRLLYTCCGSKKCRLCGGKKYMHGPYWYAERKTRHKVRGKMREKTETKYIGKKLMTVHAKSKARTARSEEEGDE